MGIQASSASPTITNCTISGNTADYNGGGIYCAFSSPTITNCTICGNTATFNDGGGICCIYSSPTITNCTISGNTATDNGGGIYCYSSSTNITNSIIWENIPDEIYGDSPAISYSCIKGGYGDPVTTHNIVDDPLFIDPNAGDYRLWYTSPCIDAGDPSAPELPSTDKDGNPRIINGKPDIGAYEYIEYTLDRIEISGVGVVDENSSSNYTATAYFSDGTIQDVTDSASWTENSLYASINSSGVLTTDEVSSNKTVTITASYTYDNITKEGSKNITIKDISSTSSSGGSSSGRSSGSKNSYTGSFYGGLLSFYGGSYYGAGYSFPTYFGGLSSPYSYGSFRSPIGYGGYNPSYSFGTLSSPFSYYSGGLSSPLGLGSLFGFSAYSSPFSLGGYGASLGFGGYGGFASTIGFASPFGFGGFSPFSGFDAPLGYRFY